MRNIILLFLIITSSAANLKSAYPAGKNSYSLNAGKKKIQVQPDRTEKWRPLFDGKNLNGWIVFLGYRAENKILHLNKNSQNVFTVENGGIHFYKNFSEDVVVPEGFLATEKEYGNFHLKLEFKWGSKKFAQRINKKRNSGIMFLARDTAGFWPTSVECQVMEGDVGDIYTQNNTWITTTVGSFISDQATRNKIPVYSPGGKIYNHGGSGSRRLAHDARYDKSEGWNTVEIVVMKNKARYIVNGKENNRLWNIRYVNPQDSLDKKPLLKGRILLQAEATEIYYRNIMIKEDQIK